MVVSVFLVCFRGMLATFLEKSSPPSTNTNKPTGKTLSDRTLSKVSFPPFASDRKTCAIPSCRSSRKTWSCATVSRPFPHSYSYRQGGECVRRCWEPCWIYPPKNGMKEFGSEVFFPLFSNIKDMNPVPQQTPHTWTRSFSFEGLPTVCSCLFFESDRVGAGGWSRARIRCFSQYPQT